MGVIETKEKTIITKNSDGTQSERKDTYTRKIERSKEPDYIKIYIHMWCEFNGVPEGYRRLFMALAVRMSYADINDPDGGQTVSVPQFKRAICNELGWKENMLQKGLKVLCEANAIRRVGRGIYQVNPSFAGKGQWKYNAKLKQGGIENIVAKFDLRKKEVKTNIEWSENEIDYMDDDNGDYEDMEVFDAE